MIFIVVVVVVIFVVGLKRLSWIELAQVALIEFMGRQRRWRRLAGIGLAAQSFEFIKIYVVLKGFYICNF